jgi:hypothetical protein
MAANARNTKARMIATTDGESVKYDLMTSSDIKMPVMNRSQLPNPIQRLGLILLKRI